MAVYTPVSVADARAFLGLFNESEVGEYVSHTEIRQGVENSNFFLSATRGEFVLTLYERRVSADDLPFFLGFTRHLADAGIPAPRPLRLADGRDYGALNGRPAALLARLPGAGGDDSARDPRLCRLAGAALAEMHLAARSFGDVRDNDLGIAAWRGLLERAETLHLRGGGDGDGDGDGGSDGDGDGDNDDDDRQRDLARRGRRVLDAVERMWPRGLPSAVVHADLFPDNVLFDDGEIRGVIDFYFACRDFFAYDLAVCHLAWCHDAEDGDGAPADERSRALLAGYGSRRIPGEAEAEAWNVLSAGAALRFFLTRWIDTALTDDGCNVVVKDPLPMLRAAEYYLGETGL